MCLPSKRTRAPPRDRSSPLCVPGLPVGELCLCARSTVASQRIDRRLAPTADGFREWQEHLQPLPQEIPEQMWRDHRLRHQPMLHQHWRGVRRKKPNTASHVATRLVPSIASVVVLHRALLSKRDLLKLGQATELWWLSLN